MTDILKTIEANQRVLDLVEALTAFRGRVFDLGESLRDTVHEGMSGHTWNRDWETTLFGSTTT